MPSQSTSIVLAAAFVVIVAHSATFAQENHSEGALSTAREAAYQRYIPGYKPMAKSLEQKDVEDEVKQRVEHLKNLSRSSAVGEAMYVRQTSRAASIFEPAAGSSAGYGATPVAGPLGGTPFHYNFYRTFPWYPYGNYNFNYRFSRPNVRFNANYSGAYPGYAGGYSSPVNFTSATAIPTSYLYGSNLGLGAMKRVRVRQYTPQHWVYSNGRYRYVPGGVTHTRFWMFTRPPHFPQVAGY